MAVAVKIHANEELVQTTPTVPDKKRKAALASAARQRKKEEAAALEAARVNAIQAKKFLLRKRIQYSAYGIAITALTVTLPHLCCGVQAITGCWWVIAVPVALVFDLAQIMAEHAMMHRAEYELPTGVKTVSIGIIGGCTGVSMLVNCMEFCQDKTPGEFSWCLGLLLGIALPAIVLACMYLAGAYGKSK